MMLNIPGMNKIHQISNNEALKMSVRLFVKRFIFPPKFQNTAVGLAALKNISESSEIDQDVIRRQRLWISIVFRNAALYNDFDKRTLELRDSIYDYVGELRISELQGKINEFETYVRNQL